MKHCPFCAEALNPVTVFCRSCAAKLPRRLPDRRPSPGWRSFAIRYVRLQAEGQSAAWERLNRSQRSYAASLGLNPPARISGSRAGLFGWIGQAVLWSVGLLTLLNLFPGSPPRPEPGLKEVAPLVQAPSPEIRAGIRPETDSGGGRTAQESPVDLLRVRFRANIRGGPSISAAIVGKVRTGDLLESLGREGDWFILPPAAPHDERYIHATVVVPMSPVETRGLEVDSSR